MGKLEVISVCLHLLLVLASPRHAVSKTIVRYLPGFVGPLPFELETGYVSVDSVELFYYFVKSENNPNKDPLLLWLTGGPGCSVLTALNFEIGPLLFEISEYNGSLPALKLNPNSWTKVSNILFLDSPVGTGFSYARSLQDSFTGDTKSAKQAYTFIRKWLVDHSEFLSNPFYIGGDSYSGTIVPIISQHIADGSDGGEQPFINLKGYLLGNPVTHKVLEANSRVPFAYGMGILSHELFESAKINCGGNYVNVDPNNINCAKDVKAISECISRLNEGHILEPICMLASPKPKHTSKSRRSLKEDSIRTIISPPSIPGFKCRSYGYMLSYYWANNDRVRQSLNIQKGTVQEWIRCNYNLNYLGDVTTSLNFHLNLSKRRYRSLIYSGDHDMVVPFIGTQKWIKSLNYSISDDWRPWIVDRQVAGYTRTYTNNMTFATIKGGGHTAPEYKPKECVAMFKRWLSYEPL